jgi:hypothetical protein
VKQEGKLERYGDSKNTPLALINLRENGLELDIYVWAQNG